MASEVEQEVEYVELLDVPVYNNEQTGQEIITIQEEVNSEVEVNDEEVEYIEAEEVTYNAETQELEQIDGHTIIVHEGKQYMIPNELHQSGQTIVLEQSGEDEEEYVIHTGDDGNMVLEESQDGMETYYTEIDGTETEQDLNPVNQGQQETEDNDCYLLYGEDETTLADEECMEENQEEENLSRQYAVLRDGRLHTVCTDEDETDEIHGKLQVLEQSLNYEEDTNDDQPQEMEITGRNLITGQTISLNGFLEKLKKKTDNLKVKQEPPDSDYYPENVKRQRRSFYQSRNERGGKSTEPNRPDYVLIPPVNKKIIVGKTPEGKRIVAKILQIQKKINPADVVIPKPRAPKRRAPQIKQENLKKAPEDLEPRQIEELIIDNTGKILHVENQLEIKDKKNILMKKQILSKAVLDQNIVRTLSGLMELESIQKNLADKNLIIKHILKKSFEGKIIPGKEITYYYGHMEKSESIDCFNEPKINWTFISDYDEETNSEIDLNETSDSQQVNINLNDPSTFGTINEDENIPNRRLKNIKPEFEETVTLNLIVTKDEHGKKRTKVMIPQLGAVNSKCSICNKMFKSDQHLKRHMLTHVNLDMDETSDSSNVRYTCEICGKTFQDYETFTRHRRKMHQNEITDNKTEDDYSCSLCGKKFRTLGSLRRHFTMHNPSLRPLECNTCLQRFTDESSLKKHMVLHTGVKSFQCDICLKCFVHQGDLNFHRKIHDPVKRYRCEVCGKEFNRHSNMVRHSEIHRVMTSSAYKCETCGCQYNFISSLTRHIVNNHMGECPVKDTDVSSPPPPDT